MFISFLCWSYALTAAVRATIVPINTTGNSWPYQKYRSVNYTPPYLEISNRYNPSEGYLFFAPDGVTKYQLAPLIMDMSGELVWNGPLNSHAFSFGVQQYAGRSVLVYWNGTVYPEPIGRGNGAVTILNSSYERIAQVTLPGHFVEQVPNVTFPSSIDLHEIFITPRGTLIVTGNNVTTADLSSVGGPKVGWVVAALFFEIDIATNKVLFQWNSLDHLDQIPFADSLYPLGSEGFNGASQATAWGYFHINAASTYDGGYILSSRYLCSAIAINTDGSIRWRLQGRDGGDFSLQGDNTQFCYQHHVRVGRSNGSRITLHMHDNFNSPIENNTVPSTGKTLLVDLSTKQVSLRQRYLNESGPIYATAQGSFEPLPDGNVFIGHGWIPVLEEFSSCGQILSTIQFGAAQARPGGGFVSALAPTLSYRAFKQPWIGCPKTKPDVLAERTTNGTTAVYVSWNGATEVVAYTIFAGNSSTMVEYATTVAKAGFETVAYLCSAPRFVQVLPVLRSSHDGHVGCQAVSSDVVAVQND